MIGVSVEGVDEGAFGCVSEDLEATVEVSSLGGESVEVIEDFSGVPIEGTDEGFEGVFVVEGVGVDDACGPENKRLSLISPYSFHSSTSSRS